MRWQIAHVVEDAKAAATSIQKSVAKAFHSEPQRDFSMGVRAGPTPAPIPAHVRELRSGESLFYPLLCESTTPFLVLCLMAKIDGVSCCRAWLGSHCGSWGVGGNAVWALPKLLQGA